MDSAPFSSRATALPTGHPGQKRGGLRSPVTVRPCGETIRDDWDAPDDAVAVEKFKVGFGPMPQEN